MSFKDQVAKDLKATFFNLDHFAEVHQIGALNRKAKEYVVVVDNELLHERNKVKDEIENITVGDLLFFIKEEDVDFVVEVGKQIHFDKQLYLISKVKRDMGMYEVVLTSNRG